MGAGAGTGRRAGTNEQQWEELKPVFYTHVAHVSDVTVEGAERAQAVWAMVLKDTSPAFQQLRRDKGVDAPTSCLAWFYDEFFKMSHERDSSSKKLYQENLKIQSRALVAMIETIIRVVVSMDDAALRTKISSIARGHCKNRGVRSWQYPIVSEVLLETFATCLGDEWDDTTRTAWEKMLSLVLSVNVPASLEAERELTEDEVAESSANRMRSAVNGVSSAMVDEQPTELPKETLPLPVQDEVALLHNIDSQIDTSSVVASTTAESIEDAAVIASAETTVQLLCSASAPILAKF